MTSSVSSSVSPSLSPSLSPSVMSSFIALALGSSILGGCAVSSVSTPRETTPVGHVQLDLAVRPTAEASRTFPALVAASLPTADRSARQIRHELGETASVEVRLCVAASGSVESIEIARSSSLSVFDAAVIADARSWRFAPTPGPESLRTCERATITYRPRA
jgi:TonB family protein